jgi:ABC-type dipeptide/oligopeptide/nickel transport system permease component
MISFIAQRIAKAIVVLLALVVLNFFLIRMAPGDPALVMAGETDLYFTSEDIRYEASHIPSASFRVIPSVWGHQAGNGLNAVDSAFIDDALKDLLAS